MKQYQDLLSNLLRNGVYRPDRTGTGTYSIFGVQLRFDLSEGYPLLTSKKMFTKGMIEELLWFLRGSTDVRELQAVGVNFWNSWMKDDGTIGPGYGFLWRHWGDVDQIKDLIESIKTNPNSRRHMVVTWNPSLISEQALPPCHGNIIQFYVAENKLSCSMYQRSGDVFLGVPVNIASYALLTHMIAQVTNLAVGDFIHTIGDAHLYANHVEQAVEQVSRIPRPLPQLYLNPSVKDIFDFRYEHVFLRNYDPHPHIPAPVAV